MSAIWGIVRFDGAAIDRRDLARMGEALARWGPDGGDTIVHDAIGFGHRLLRVNEEDRFDAQPIHDRDARLTIVADIRLDNREDLAAELGLDPVTCRAWADSAFLAPAYRRWGDACPRHLLGDFAFALWDAAAGKLMLVRDHMGQRGLYFHHGGDFLAFATDIEALWALPEVPRTLSDTAFARALTLDRTPHPGATAYLGIEQVQRAGRLVVHGDGGGSTQTIYWRPQPAPEHLGRDERYYLTAYRAVLDEAIACRVRRLERSPALFMSGAFDSGTIAALAGPALAARGQRLIAVSSVLPEGSADAPLRDARRDVEAFRAFPWIDIHYHVEGEQGLYDDPESQFAADGRSVVGQFVQSRLAAMAAAHGARLVMDGYGGDYTLHRRAPHWLGRLLRGGRFGRFAREFGDRRRATGQSVAAVLRNDVLGAFAPRSLRRRFGFGVHPSLDDIPIAADFARALMRGGALAPGESPGGRGMDIVEQAGAAASPPWLFAGRRGMDFTRPFHDKRVVELALALPDDMHFRNGLDRHLPRTALVDCLPNSLLRSSRGNTSPTPDFARVALGAAPALLASTRTLDREGRLSAWIDFGRIEAVIAAADETSPRDWARLAVAMRALLLARHRLWFERSNG